VSVQAPKKVIVVNGVVHHTEAGVAVQGRISAFDADFPPVITYANLVLGLGFPS
jgi:hypothetical protein